MITIKLSGKDEQVLKAWAEKLGWTPQEVIHKLIDTGWILDIENDVLRRENAKLRDGGMNKCPIPK